MQQNDNSYHDKVYPIDKAPVLPFHANCRCTYLPVISEEILVDKTGGKEKEDNSDNGLKPISTDDII